MPKTKTKEVEVKVDLAKAAAAATSEAGHYAGVVLRDAPYDLAHPEAPAPERLRQDPRIPGQLLTAKTVELSGVPVGRVVMVEFPDVRGWFYQPVLAPAGARAKKLGKPVSSLREATRVILEAVASA